MTRLSPAQVHEDEGTFQLLGERYTLTEAVEFFLSNFTRPHFTLPIAEAVRAFLESKEKDGMTSRSSKQLESTLRQFEAFAFIHGLEGGGRVALESGRASLVRRSAATHEEIARRMPKEHRSSFRAAVRAIGESSNLLENLNKQIRRRTKVVSIFPNKESCLRLIASVLMETSDDWESGRSYLNPENLS